MVSSDEINRRLEARRRGVKYPEPGEKARVGIESPNARECPSCHTQNPPTAKFCVGCGEKLEKPEIETEKGFSPVIKGPEESAPEKPIQKKHYVTNRPDDFSKSRKLEPIVPTDQKTAPEVETFTPPATETRNCEPETGTPKTKSDVDPVERIKKAKELLDLGAITQEDFDKIKNKYLDEI